MISTERFSLFRKLGFFKDFSDKELNEFLGICAERIYNPREPIFKEGDSGDEFYIIISGEIEIVKSNNTGQQQLLAVLEPGSVFGEMSIIDSSPRSADAIVGDSEVELLIIKRAFLEDLAEKNLELATKLILTLVRYICERLRLTSERFLFAQNMLNRFDL